MTETATDLLEAVDVEWQREYGRVVCPECGWFKKSIGDSGLEHAPSCRRPSTRNLDLTYTGPALGTPELDALLLVAGQRWLRSNNDLRYKIYSALHRINGDGELTTTCNVAIWLLETCDTPGHALARAIREARG